MPGSGNAADPSGERALRERSRRAVLEAVPRDMGRGDVEALRRRTLKVLDAQLVDGVPSQSRARVACARGCAMCCHLRVMATPAEVLGLAAYIRGSLDADGLSALAARISETAARIRALPRDRVLATNVPCPLLVDGACSMYPARPLNCRAYHSLDVEACRVSFEHPEDLSLTHPQSALISRVNEGVQQGFIDAMRAVAVDTRQYELVTALDEALQDPDAVPRFERGEAVFLRALRF
jgi:Fe-S-cluster containining protein